MKNNKYELMLVINGAFDEAKVNKITDDCLKILKSATNVKINNLGQKKLAYEIKKCYEAWYVQVNFENNQANEISEFNRLTLINNNVLRFLLLNEEKYYGYNAINNPKKVKSSEIKAKKFAERQAKKQELRVQLSKANELNKEDTDKKEVKEEVNKDE